MSKKAFNEKIIVYLLLGLAIVALLWAVYSFYKTSFFGERYNEALANENSQDKCQTPAGYNDESWREHMSHHPEIYEECLT